MLNKICPRLLGRCQSTVAAVKRSSQPPNAKFLPESYACNRQWDSYLRSQMDEYKLKTGTSSELLIAAKDHAVKGGKFYELDIDTLALGIGGGLYDENELDIFEKSILPAFRRGPRASKWLDSTPAIITRAYSKQSYYARLRNLVANKKDFGFFPDHISFAQLLDSLISQDLKEDAAFFATEWAFQEDQSVSRLTNGLSLFACWQRGLQLEKFELKLSAPGEENEDEQIVRVNFLINPHNDLHFDLPGEHLKVGKTLLTLGQLHSNANCFVLGCALFECFANSVNFLKSSKHVISADTLDKFEQLLGLAETREDASARWKPIFDQHIDRSLVDRKIGKEDQAKLLAEFKVVRESLAKSGLVANDSNLVHGQLTSFIQKSVEEESKRDISLREQQLSKEWPELRKKLVEQQTFEAGRLEVIATSRQRLEELRENMETLAYFERKDDIGVYQSLGEENMKRSEEEKSAKEIERRSRRWKKPIVKREEARPNVGIYPITGI